MGFESEEVALLLARDWAAVPVPPWVGRRIQVQKCGAGASGEPLLPFEAAGVRQ